MKKRILSLLICLVLLAGVLPLSAAAESILATPTNLKWDITGTTASWDPVPNADCYHLMLYIKYDATTVDRLTLLDLDAPQCSYTFSEIEPGQIYYFSVSARADSYSSSATITSGLNTDHASQDLTIPNLSWNAAGTVASWDPIPNAEYYEVDLFSSDGTKVCFFKVTDCQCDFTDNIVPNKTYYFTLYAVVEGYGLTEITGKSKLNRLPILTHLQWDETRTIASWDPLPEANCYLVTLVSSDGKSGDTVIVNECQYNFAAEMDAEKTYYFIVCALVDGYEFNEIITQSGLNEPLALSAPTNLQWDETWTIASWDPVPYATSYVVRLYCVDSSLTETNVSTRYILNGQTQSVYPYDKTDENSYYFTVEAENANLTSERSKSGLRPSALQEQEPELPEEPEPVQEPELPPEETQPTAPDASVLTPTLTGPMPFEDVPADEWYYGNVSLAYSYELMNGMTATTFDPEGNVTLAQAVTLAVRAHHLYYGMEAVQAGFGDAWYLPYVQAAIQYGIMTGKEFTDYSRPATRAELAYLFAHVLSQDGYGVLNQVETISDVPQSMQYAAEILQMYRAGVLTGYADGSFQPGNTVRRCEVAAIITRVILPTQRIAAK